MKNTDNKNIFSLDDIKDLPEEMIKIIQRRIDKTSIMPRVSVLLKKHGKPLHINNILVGYYRKYGDVLDRKKLIMKCYSASHQGTHNISYLGNATYEYKEKRKSK